MSGNPLRDMTKVVFGPVLGSQVDQVLGPMGEPEKMGATEAQAAPPTSEDAKAAAAKSELGKVKTYGRMGTIKNVGGVKGVASSLLNLSAPSLTGK